MEPTPEAIKERFAKRLSDEMASRNWSQSELARRASEQLPGDGKLSRDNIWNYVNHRALPNPPFLQALALALETTPESLLPERHIAASRSGSTLPTTDVRDAGEGMAFLRVNRRVPWDVAVQILALINQSDMNVRAVEREPSGSVE